MYLNALVLVSGGCDEPATDANTRTDFFYPLRKLKKKVKFSIYSMYTHRFTDLVELAG